MRISVEIDEETLQETIEFTGERGKGPAMTKAIYEYVRICKAAKFGALIREGAFDYEDEPEPEIEDTSDPVML